MFVSGRRLGSLPQQSSRFGTEAPGRKKKVLLQQPTEALAPNLAIDHKKKTAFIVTTTLFSGEECKLAYTGVCVRGWMTRLAPLASPMHTRFFFQLLQAHPIIKAPPLLAVYWLQCLGPRFYDPIFQMCLLLAALSFFLPRLVSLFCDNVRKTAALSFGQGAGVSLA